MPHLYLEIMALVHREGVTLASLLPNLPLWMPRHYAIPTSFSLSGVFIVSRQNQSDGFVEDRS